MPSPRPSSDEEDVDRRHALDSLFTATYDELRRLAASRSRRRPNATINTTALLNEAWLKLVRTPKLGSVPRADFIRIAGEAMRQVLVDAARRRGALKRGGPVVT